MKKTAHFLLLIVTPIFIISSCTKKDTPPPPPAPTAAYDFSYAGAPVVGGSLTFTSSLHQVTTFAWTFGDGGTSTEAAPSHVYTAVGTYLVTMTVAGDLSKKVSKEIQVFKDPVYTHLVAGDRNWRNIGYLSLSGGWDTVYYRPDARFAVSYIDPLTVAIKGDTMRFMDGASTDTVLVFNKAVQEFQGHGRTSNWTLYFDHFRDSMHYVIAPGGSAGGQSSEHFYTK